MKKNRLAAGALALAVSFTACGCGEKVYELTNDEEATVVHYAAHVITKFNKKQPEGVEDIRAYKAQLEKKAEEAEKRRKEEERQRREEEAQQEEKPGQSNGSGQAGTSDGERETEKDRYVPLSKALGLKGVKAVYRRHEITSTYRASQSYMVRASSGNELLVLYVNLKNTGSKTVNCDILSKMPSFRLTINGELSVSADTTILLNDLGTYQGNINAGDKAGTVLIFQLKKGAVKSIDTMDLEVTAGDTSSLVQLAG